MLCSHPVLGNALRSTRHTYTYLLRRVKKQLLSSDTYLLHNPRVRGVCQFVKCGRVLLYILLSNNGDVAQLGVRSRSRSLDLVAFVYFVQQRYSTRRGVAHSSTRYQVPYNIILKFEPKKYRYSSTLPYHPTQHQVSGIYGINNTVA